MARGPRPVYPGNESYKPRNRKSPGQQTRAEKETRAHSYESLATEQAMNAGEGSQNRAQENTRSTENKKPKALPVWGYYKQLRSLKISVLILAERSLDRA